MISIGSLLVLHVLASPLQLGDAEIRGILKDRVDLYRKTVGIVVGWVDEKGSRVVGYGKLNRESAGEVDGNTMFEIGSATKAFTAILLADMAERGEVGLDDPVAKYLPSSVKVPAKDGKEITLRHLATHTSGLPRMPSNFAPRDPLNPYADYSVERMYAFLSGHALRRAIGEKYEYSNLGAGLLGYALALRAGTSYEELVKKRIAEPLGMASTTIALTPEQHRRLAAGYGQTLEPAKNWDMPTLAGAGALRSSVHDLLRFVSANLGLAEPPLASALARTHEIQVQDIGAPGLAIALGWHVLRNFGADIVWHNGGTLGYHSFLGFDKKKRAGVVVLSNSNNDIDDIGKHLLESRYPLAKLEPTVERRAVKLEASALEAYAGVYAANPVFSLTITREGERLFVQATGQQRFEIFPESETKFFLKVVDAQITFVRDEKGAVTHLILHQAGRDLEAKRQP